jgi:uncharacterized protein involved in outer membrane biogenesis
MLKKALLVVGLIFAVLSIGLFFWARAVFTQDMVRTALAAQLSTALGQPVKVGSIGAGIYPRVTVNLGDVAIGDPARVRVQTLHVGTDFWALISRRIEHARLDLSGARIELPLPAFAIGSGGSAAQPTTKPPVELVSIDEIALRNVAIVSGGRTLTGDVEVVPEGSGAILKKIALRAENATVDVTGRLVTLSPPTGDVTIKAGALNFDQLLAFANAFSSGAGMATTSHPTQPTVAAGHAPAAASSMNISATLEAERASVGTLALAKLTGKARLTAAAINIDPIAFDVFGGRYSGSLVFGLGATPDFRLNASLSGVDVAAATAFAGSPGTISGRLSGRLTVSGRGMDAPSVMRTARGNARVDIVDGIVKNLGLVRTIVVATSGRSGGGAGESGSRDEPFTRLGTTLAIAAGSATTEDLRFTSKDFLLAAAGSVRLDGSAINLAGQVQLSDDLSKQAGQDLVRYTQEGGRVTLPVAITGSANAPHVMIDVAGMAKRAVTNRAQEEAQKALKKGLGDLLKK